MYTEEIKKKQKTLDIRKKILKNNQTRSELVMHGLLLTLKDKIGKVMVQKGFIGGNGYCICDFYIPKLGICVEVDGGYHSTDTQKRKDWYKNKYLTQERRLRVFRITDIECFELTKDTLFSMLTKCKLKSVNYSPKYSFA